MLLVGLTGGIGSGKTTASAALARRGAVVIDADRIAREVVEPGQPAFRAIVGHFGNAVVGPDGRLDRLALAGRVFSDAGELAVLNRITHPEITRMLLERVAEHEGTGSIVILDIPLLNVRTATQYPLRGIIVVDVPEELAVERLMAYRGFTEEDARARIAAQSSREARRAMASVVVDNSGDEAALERQIDEVWRWLSEEARRDPGT